MLMAKVKVELIGCGWLFTSLDTRKGSYSLFTTGDRREFTTPLLLIKECNQFGGIIGGGLPIKIIPAEVF